MGVWKEFNKIAINWAADEVKKIKIDIERSNGYWIPRDQYHTLSTTWTEGEREECVPR